MPAIVFVSSVLLFPDQPFESGGKDEEDRPRFNGQSQGALNQLFVLSMLSGSPR